MSDSIGYCDDCGAQLDSLCPSDATACPVVAPNLVQAGDLWLMEDEDAYHPDKMEYSLLIQCANADQVRHAMKTGKIEFTVFAHYPQNVHVDTSPPLTPQDDAQR